MRLLLCWISRVGKLAFSGFRRCCPTISAIRMHVLLPLARSKVPTNDADLPETAYQASATFILGFLRETPQSWGLATVPTPPPTVEPQPQVQGKRQHWAVLSRSGPWNHDFIGISLRALTYLLCRLHCHSTVCSGGWHFLQN